MVRQVGHHVVGRLDQAQQVLVERVALDQSEVPGFDALESLSQEGRQATVELDRGDRAPAGQRPPVSRPRPGPISRIRRPGRAGLGQDRLEDVGVGQEVLRQPVLRPEAGRTQRGAVRWAVRTSLRPAGCVHRAANGSDGRASRSRPARSPAPNRRAPAAPIIAPLSVHSAGRGTTNGIPIASASPARRARSAPLAATPPPSTIERAPVAPAARIVLVTSTSTTASWKPQAELRDRGARQGLRCLGGLRRLARIGARLDHDPASRGLEAGEAEVERIAEPRPGKDAITLRRTFCRAADGRPARVAQAEQPADLVECLAGGIVQRRAEQAVGQVVAHLDQEGVTARHDQRHQREDRIVALGLPGRAATPRTGGPRGG